MKDLYGVKLTLKHVIGEENEKVEFKILASQTFICTKWIYHFGLVNRDGMDNLLVTWYCINEKMAGDEMMDFEKVTI